MEEITPGLWHRTARHPHIGSEVSCPDETALHIPSLRALREFVES